MTQTVSCLQCTHHGFCLDRDAVICNHPDRPKDEADQAPAIVKWAKHECVQFNQKGPK